MTESLDAVVVARRLSAERHDETPVGIPSPAEWDVTEEIDPDDADAVNQGLAQIERGDFASDDEVAAAFRCFGT